MKKLIFKGLCSIILICEASLGSPCPATAPLASSSDFQFPTTSWRHRRPSRRFLPLAARLAISLFETSRTMSSRRDYRSSRNALFDGIEEGGIRASPYSSCEIDEHDNDRAIDGLHDRVNILKRLTGDIHEEVETHNRMLDRMGNDMDASRGVLSGTMDRFKMVFENKSSRRMVTLVASFLALFLLVYYLTK
ncbi:Bet1-like SNARE 1-1 [Apostasia shenzhenica]|uniref:Bet1-like SNARE 1-1 n=1 Tax=Apostasia shenzhenica TaxID=1088818 RepID=A0A2I0BAA4_9ASPA|nr:Bet1-like SNARE 1-1 [Apostasia shenzhenica]